MSVETVAEMSIEELRAFVAQMINERLGKPLEHSQPYRIGRKSPEVWEAIRNNVVKPAPGAPKPTELLREEVNIG